MSEVERVLVGEVWRGVPGDYLPASAGFKILRLRRAGFEVEVEHDAGEIVVNTYGYVRAALEGKDG